MTTDKQKLAEAIEDLQSFSDTQLDRNPRMRANIALIVAALRAPSSPDLCIDAPHAPEPAQSCPSCGGSGLYGDAAMRAINGDIPDETRDVRWAVNVLLETIAKQFEAWDTMDLWRSQAAETVRSHKHNFVTPPASSDAQHDAQLEGLAIGLEQRGEKSAAHLIRLAIKRLAQSVATSVAIKGEEPLILDYDAAPEAGEAKPIAWPKEEVGPGHFVDVDPSLITSANRSIGFGNILRNEAARLRKLADEMDPDFAAPVSADAGLGVSYTPTPLDLMSAADAFDDIEVNSDGYCRWTDVANASQKMRREIRNLSQPLSSASGALQEAWTPAQYWEYAEGLLDEWKAEQLRETMAERGLALAAAPQS